MSERRTIEGLEIERFCNDGETAFDAGNAPGSSAGTTRQDLLEILWDSADPARLREAQALAVEAAAEELTHESDQEALFDYASRIRAGEVKP